VNQRGATAAASSTPGPGSRLFAAPSATGNRSVSSGP
jgi:hypothetical protein